MGIIIDRTKAFPENGFYYVFSFDENLQVKEDYDFTIRNIVLLGGVIRFDNYTVEAKHYTNPGGCQEFRKEEVEREATQYLLKRWPKWIKLNPKRENEVLIKKRLK